MNAESTITAISTPPGEGGIAVIRMSGPDSRAILEKVFSKGSRKSWRSHRLYHGWIMERDQPIDEVVAAVFIRPRSYTGEDMVEISCHGGVFVSRRILELLIRHGALPAKPGEFTQRAFLNGKMDLAQAEAVADLVHARTEMSRRAAVHQLKGAFSEITQHLRQELIELCSLLEAGLDFPDEENIEASHSEIQKRLSALHEELEKALHSYECGKMIREGIRMAIVGRPNVGKSTVLNRLLDKERSIVTEIAGTTRDTVEDEWHLEGFLAVISDTAGLRESSDVIEKEGIKRTVMAMENADVIVWIVDGSQSWTNEDDDVLERITQLRKETIIVLNKQDLNQEISPSFIREHTGYGSICPASALKGSGMEKLKETLKQMVILKAVPFEEAVLTRARHAEGVQRALRRVEEAAVSHRQGVSVEFVLLDLKGAMEALEEMTGRITTDEVLNHIFSEFCIGK